MPNQKIFGGASFGTTFAKAPQTAIPGLAALGIFGTKFDAINTNRVAGGSTFADAGSPVYSSNYVTVNAGGTTIAGIDTATAETSSVVTSGWTIFMVCRKQAGHSITTTWQIGTTSYLFALMNDADSNASNHPSYAIRGFGITSGTDNTIDLGASADLSQWRFLWAKWPGGTGQSYSFGSLTDAMSKTTTTTYSRTGNATNHFRVGYHTNGQANSYQCDVPLFGVCTQPLTSPQLDNARAFAQGVLGVRGISGF